MISGVDMILCSRWHEQLKAADSATGSTVNIMISDHVGYEKYRIRETNSEHMANICVDAVVLIR